MLYPAERRMLPDGTYYDYLLVFRHFFLFSCRVKVWGFTLSCTWSRCWSPLHCPSMCYGLAFVWLSDLKRMYKARNKENTYIILENYFEPQENEVKDIYYVRSWNSPCSRPKQRLPLFSCPFLQSGTRPRLGAPPIRERGRASLVTINALLLGSKQARNAILRSRRLDLLTASSRGDNFFAV